jgi:potassium-transporting ATPase KdpC subunit
MLRAQLKISILFTLITAVTLGILYPLAVTAIGQLAFAHQANGQLITQDNRIIGSQIIGQTFSSDRYFHGRPSAAGNGYDATSSGGSNYGPSNQKLLTRIEGDVAQYAANGNGQPVPIDLVTASGSGLDSDISPAAALYQVSRVARVRHLSDDAVRNLVLSEVQGRQFGVLGDPRVNVLELNLALDRLAH